MTRYASGAHRHGDVPAAAAWVPALAVECFNIQQRINNTPVFDIPVVCDTRVAARSHPPTTPRVIANQSTTCAGSVSDGRSATTPEHGSAAAESCRPHQQELQIHDRRSQMWEWWTLTPRPRYAACRLAADVNHTRHTLPARQSPAPRTADMAPAHRRATSTVPARHAE